MKLIDLIKVKSRFHRSVQIELDSALDDYVVTQSGLKVLTRIENSLGNKLGTRAWTITGPYGSGKSAFIVFLKTLLGEGSTKEVSIARELLKKADKDLYKEIFESDQILTKSRKRFCTALVSAGRERIEHAILKGLLFGLRNFHKKSRSSQPIIQEIENALKNCSLEDSIPNDLVITLCERAAEDVIKSKGAGLLLVVDELGKCLETAVLNPHNDIFVLQKLAETASRSDKHPFLLFTVLHQSFERYAARLDSEKRNEWSKIQGRFEDISFVDSSDQVYKLIASAIVQPSQKNKLSQIAKSTKKMIVSFESLVNDNPLFTSKSSKMIMRRCLPLHPLTTMALVPLFRSKFAQNERSLFAFLTSTEPGSFSDFLGRTEITKYGEGLPLYTLHHLYDYLISNFGVNLFTHSNGKKWVEIDQALSRSTDELELQVIKTIGVLDLLGENFGIPVGEEAIQCAIGLSSKGISKALKNLCKKSVVVYRRYSSSYVLWGGSDIDVEQKIREVKQDKVSRGDLIEMLNKLFPLRPKVAKRYLYKTGTLRYFNMRYVDVKNLAFELEKDIIDADGQILLVINSRNTELLKVTSVQEIFRDSESEEKQKTIIGVLPNAERVLNVFTELLALQWIKKNTPELQGDPVAMREVDARILQMERMVNEATNELFYSNNFKHDSETHWIDSDLDEPRVNITRKELSMMVSDTCNRVYYKTPVIKNELVNRAFISATAVSARRRLLHAILDKPHEERLGIEGFPPEYSLYQSLLNSSGLHKRKDNDGWGFVTEHKDLEKSWRPLWKDIVRFLEKREDRKVPVTDLIDLMKEPPYGIKAGVIPIILSVIIKAYDTEIALFELGTFRPVIKSTDYDLLTKVPHKFALQLCRITGVKAEVFDQITKTIVKGKGVGASKKYSLMQIVKMLCQFTNNLPSYTKTTTTVSDRAKAVRKCLLEAKEPATLLYRDLPKACGLKPIAGHGKAKENVAMEFVKMLKDVLTELQRKESDLFGKMENILLHTFSLSETHSDNRSSIVERASCVIDVAFDSDVKSFLTRVVDDLDDKQWIDSIGTVITKRPPLSWTDDDLLRFEHEMIAMSSRIAKYERLVSESKSKSANAQGDLIQISITSNRKYESFKVIHQTPSEKEKVEQLQSKLSDVFNELDHDENIDLILGSLSEYAVNLIKEHGNVKQKLKD